MRIRTSYFLFALLFTLWIIAPVKAQDLQLPHAQPQDTIALAYHTPMPLRTLVNVGNSLPLTFKGTTENKILHAEYLAPFFNKLCSGTESVRIVHIGDSHVRGHVFPVSTRRVLEQAFGSQAVFPDSVTYYTSAVARETGAPGLIYHAVGINGATTANFCNTEKIEEIATLHPDLIILSFGTNESFTRRYDPAEHYAQMDAFLTLLRHYMPDAIFMMTTPPGCYVRASRSRRVINPRTETAVKTILIFAENRQIAAWDLYDLVGGKQYACLNWINHSYMQRDRIHFTAKGYTLQGILLGEAILKAFNDYVEH